MEHSISLSEDGTYVLLTMRGDMTRERAIRINVEAHAFGREHGVSRYLVDATECRNVESVIDNYDFAYRDMQETEGIDRSARVATLVSPGDHSHDFVETVARNAGFDFTIFTDRALAIRHLRE